MYDTIPFASDRNPVGGSLKNWADQKLLCQEARLGGAPTNIHVLQHVPFEDLGNIEPALLAQDHRLTWTHFFEQPNLPGVHTVDAAIVLGGPMSVHDQHRYPWLLDERQWLEAFIATGKGVLGICLGAQQLATVLGGTVTHNFYREIGWFPVTLAETARKVAPFQRLSGQLTAFHWHEESFSLPPGMQPLGTSPGCGMQGFHNGSGLVALQFHLETPPAAVARLIQHDEEPQPGPFVQTPEIMLGNFTAFNTLEHVLDIFLEDLMTLWTA